MSSKQLGQKLDKQSVDAAVNAGIGGDSVLVLSAFLEERERWESEHSVLQNKFDNKAHDLNIARLMRENESFLVKFWYGRVLKKPTPDEKVEKVMIEEADSLMDKLLAHESLEPNTDMYELAALGNNLFTAR